MSDVFDLAPKVELHLHLEGAVPPAALWRLAQAYGDPETPSLEAMTARFEYRDFAHFIETWQWMLPFFRTPDDWTAVAQAVAESLAAQGIIYAEASISPTDFRQHELPLARIATAVRRGLDRVEGTTVNLLVDLVRDTGPEWCARTLEEVIEVAPETGIVGITIGGSEHDFPPGPYAAVYRRAGEVGLGRTVHAGEAGGPENVWTALDQLGVDRIGHGVRAVEDPALVAHLVSRQVPLEVCPTSNIRTGVVEGWATHPIIELIERGARVTINSDDPTYFDCSLAGDLRQVASLTALDVERHTRYAIDAAFTDDATKRRLTQAVTAFWASRDADLPSQVAPSHAATQHRVVLEEEGDIDATGITIRRTTDADVPWLPAVERSAARTFATIPELAWIVEDDVLDEAQHRRFAAAGWSWVADSGGSPVGFICAERVGDEVHVWEVAVAERHQQQGIGSRLMARVEAQARDAGARALTLTTFRDVSWNGPFYASLGYEVIDYEACDERLRRILELEVRAGQPPDRRCAMRLRL